MFYSNLRPYNVFFFIMMLLLLLIDLAQFFVVGIVIIPTLLCFYSVLLMQKPDRIKLGLVFFVQCLEFFCFHNFLFLAGAYLIPITALALFFRKNLYPSRLQAISLALIGATIQTYALEQHILGIVLPPHYTIMRICGTIIVAICFSLTINIWGTPRQSRVNHVKKHSLREESPDF